VYQKEPLPSCRKLHTKALFLVKIRKYSLEWPDMIKKTTRKVCSTCGSDEICMQNIRWENPMQ
jgi:hypothetical protein